MNSKNKKLMWLGQKRGYFHLLVEEMACPSVIKVARALDKTLEDCNYNDVNEFKEILKDALNADYIKEIKNLRKRIKFIEEQNELFEDDE